MASCLPWRGIVLVAATCAAGCNRSEPAALHDLAAVPRAEKDADAIPATVPLIDRAADLGIEFVYRNGSEADLCTILESLGGGLGWLDFDRDGWPDLIATGGGSYPSDRTMAGRASALFRNLDGKQFASVGALAGIDTSALYSHGVAVADFDNDGFQDALISGYGRPQLWHNMGDGTFEEIAESAGMTNDLWGSSAGWADFNGDGNLDLYLAHYANWSFSNHPVCYGNKPGEREICAPREFQPLPDVLFLNQGDGSFLDGSAAAGLRDDGKGLGVLLCDIEPDGDMDIYVANDTVDNFLYVNDGAARFEEIGVESGTARSARAHPDGSMGVALCDIDRDGRPDLWVANYERETFALYRNEGRHCFLHISQRLGITDLGGLFVGFGTACEDFDSDGDDDLVVANGHVIKVSENAPRKQLPLLLQYDGRRFQRAPSAPGSYFGDAHEGRGLAVADFDADGDLDIAISNLNEPLALLENRFRERNRCLELNLIGVRSNRDAIGARVELHTNDGTKYRQAIGGGSYLSHSYHDINFALSEDQEPQSLVVHWPSGQTQSFDASSLAGQVTLVENATQGESPPRLFVRKEFR